MTRSSSFLVYALALVALPVAVAGQTAGSTAAPAAAAAAAPVAQSVIVDVPAVDIGAATLAAREQAQRATLPQFEVPIDFRFTDRLAESGITFVHQPVDDAGPTYKAAHYDHGNGIAAADVDGDGRVDLYFVSQLGSCGLWLNQGGGRFRDATAEAGVAMTDRIAISASFADIDNDGDQDLYVTTVRQGNVLFENDGKGRFRDITASAGVGYDGHSSAAVFLDYDRDGLLDLFLVNVGRYSSEQKGRGGYYVAFEDAFSGHTKPERTEESVLYRNLGGNRFANTSAEAGLRDSGWSGDAVITDFNRDGWPDLYVLNMQGDDHYYENVGGKFRERGAELFPMTPWGAMGGKAFDYDNDGDQDLLVTDMHSDMLEEVPPEQERTKLVITGAEKFFHEPANNIFGNAFYVNEGGTFREASLALGLENYWPWGVSVDDLNADGWQDALITSSMNFPFRYGVNSLLINNGGKGFLEAAMLLGIEPRRDGRTRKPWFTVDCSASQQIAACQGRTGMVTVTGTLGTRSSVIFDLDDDGDLDIVTNELHDVPMVLVSDLAQKRQVSWLQVALNGTRSNRNGIGAEVTVRTAGGTQVKVMDGATGYLSHGVMPLNFGLGAASEVTAVEVRWPSGAQQTVPGPIAAGQRITVSEPAAEATGSR
jgi:hypothetical protein